MFQMMGVFVEFERAMIQERVRAGLRRAKQEGTRLGLPRDWKGESWPPLRRLGALREFAR